MKGVYAYGLGQLHEKKERKEIKDQRCEESDCVAHTKQKSQQKLNLFISTKFENWTHSGQEAHHIFTLRCCKVEQHNKFYIYTRVLALAFAHIYR